MRQRRFGSTIKDLLLAMVNATLLLLALCLFLALQLSQRVEAITDSFARNLVTLAPLRSDIAAMSTEVTGLRTDIAALRDESADLSQEAAERISGQLGKLETRLDDAAGRIDDLRDSPERLLDHAIDRAAQEVRSGIDALGGCMSTPAQ